MKLKLLCGVACAALCAANAEAANFNGWYLGVEGGWSWVEDNDAVYATSLGFASAAEIEAGDGWAILATLGYAFGNWRIEGELGYRDNDIDSIAIGPLFTPFPGGDINETTLMVNALYDIHLGSRFILSGGIGIGADYVAFNDGAFVDDDDWGFAYQAIVGLSYAISKRTDLTLTYRYLVADGGDLGGVNPIEVARNEVYALDDIGKHALTVGVRFDLAADELPLPPPPPPPPPPEPPKPRQFLVFFGFNKSNLTEEAERVVAEAAQAVRDFGSVLIAVVGHTDTVGSPAYNQALSERRAGAVRASLVAKGIPEGQINASGHGETELLVQTGDNVKEPQNRRATIDVSDAN